MTSVFPADSYNPPLTSPEIAKDVFKAIHGAGGFGVERQEGSSKLLITIPVEEPIEVTAEFAEVPKAIVKLGTVAT